MDNVMTFTIGKCLQTALLVTPLTVLVGWGMGVDGMTLVFGGFEIVSLFTTMILLNFLLGGLERVTWLQGTLLLADWGLITLAAYFTTPT
ncbi:uncharacterized protein PG998_002811 [Apiospora kogelbergensis]|uniref:uncharacterized protein n=1 Tax=Apiospora kogelbergensis TaxID=1337665 RepID=UPI00312DDF3F